MNYFNNPSSGSDSPADTQKNIFEFVGVSIPSPAESPSCNSSTSVKRKREPESKYKKCWEDIPELSSWILAEPNNDYLAFCKYCNITLSMSGKNDLIKHANTKKHQRNSKINEPKTNLSKNMQNETLSGCSKESTYLDSDSDTILDKCNSLALPLRKRNRRQYRKSWEAIPECTDWLIADPKSNYRGFCKCCNISLTLSGQYDLKKHSTTKKHQENSNNLQLKRDLSENNTNECSLEENHLNKTTKDSATKNTTSDADSDSDTNSDAQRNGRTTSKRKRNRRQYKIYWDARPECRGWLMPDPKNNYRAFCKFCNISLNLSGQYDLRKHSTTKKHQENSNNLQLKRDLSENITNESSLEENHLNKTKKFSTENETSHSDSDTNSDAQRNGRASSKRKRNGRQYKKSWEAIPECRGWLMTDPKNNYRGFCKFCNISIAISGQSDLKKHSNTMKHQDNSNRFQLKQDLSENNTNESILEANNSNLNKTTKKASTSSAVLIENTISDADLDTDSDTQKIGSTSSKKRVKYRKSWEQLPECSGWLMAEPNRTYLAFCKYCNVSLSMAGKSDIIRHSKTKKHREQLKIVQLQSNLCEYKKNGSSMMAKKESVNEAAQENNFISVTIPLTGETYKYPLHNLPTSSNITSERKEHYCKSWETIPKFSSWLMEEPNDKYLAFCKYCNVSLTVMAGEIDLIKHSNTKKHQENSGQLQPNLTSDSDSHSDTHISLSASPKKSQRNYSYQKHWEMIPELRGWLMAEPTNKRRAFCKYCDISLSMSGTNDLIKHSNTKKHQENANRVQLKPNLSENIKNESTILKVNDLQKTTKNSSTENPTLDSHSDTNSDTQENESASSKKRVKYRKSWEKLPECSGWLMAEPNRTYLAFCKYCNVSLAMAGKNDLIRHANTGKHQRNWNLIQLEPSLLKFNQIDLENNGFNSANNDSNLEENVRNAEIQLSAFCVEHNLPFRAMDQLSQLIKKICPDSRIASKISCGSKKTTAIIKNVIGTTHFQLICEAMRNQCFSIYFDAESPPSSSSSCDDYCSTTKLLSVIVRIRFNDKIRDMFLTMIKVNNTNAETLFAHIIKFFNDNKIDYKKNLIGIAADATTVITGGTNSVAKLLEKVCPDLKIFKCVSHSFNLCSSYAAEKLPESLEILVRNIYNYLSNNPNNRLAGFDKIQSILEHKPIKMLHPYQSRWLSLEPLVRSISGRYNCLTIYFNNIVHFDKIGNNAKDIFDQLNNPLNELFLQFLNFILPKINKFNKLVQSDSPQIFKLYAEMRHIIQSILRCFIKPIYLNKCEIQKIQFNDPTMVLPLDGINCGDQVNVTMSLNEKLTTEQKRFFKIKCLDYYVELCTQIYKRFKFNDEFLRLCNLIDPEVVKSRQETDSISILSHYFQSFNTTNELFQKIHNEWTQLISFDFDSLFDDYSLSAISVEDFWYRIFDLKYEDNNDIAFPTLKELVLHVLTLPNSSANVERIFSAINLNNIKINHTFNTETLIGILHTKEYLLDDRIQSESSIFHDKFDSTRFMKSIKCNEDV